MIYLIKSLEKSLNGVGKFGIWIQKEMRFLSMGEKAIFVESSTDTTNRVKSGSSQEMESVWGDPQKIQYTVTGLYLSELFKRAFVDGLHNPMLRPIANEWETALLKTVDLIQPCSNPNCDEKWYVLIIRRNRDVLSVKLSTEELCRL